jgi:hypothetical protein
MGFQIRVEGFGVVPQWRLAAAVAGVVGLLYGAWLLRETPVDILLLLLSGLPILLWLFFKREPIVIGILSVDEAGQPGWQSLGAPTDTPVDPSGIARHPLRLVRWHMGDAVIWVRVSRPDGWRGDVFVDRARCDQSDWDSLRRWLVWVERGAA